jgi:hypothetical protein
MNFSRWKNFLVVFVALEFLAIGAYFVVTENKNFTNQSAAVSDGLDAVKDVTIPEVVSLKLKNPPEIIKGIYVTGYSAGSKKYLEYLSGLFATTEINAVVIDIKGSDGSVSYKSLVPDVKKYNLYYGAIKDIDALLKFFHDKNIYVIGRIAVFEDPLYSKARPNLAIYNRTETVAQNKLVLWQDRNRLSWMDPSSKDVWDYNISLAKEASARGFDEINFDYVRFPSDGKVGETGYPAWDGIKVKADVINEFFHYLRNNLPGEKLSVDLFGQTTTNKDDMGIGQLLEDSFETFDYVSPMVYPSHYVKGFLGFGNPAEHPYDMVKYAMSTALNRMVAFETKRAGLAINAGETSSKAVPLAKFRPWLQDFDMGANYTSEMIRAEIGATKDALGSTYNGFMLWNAANRYTQGAVTQQYIPSAQD